MSPAKQTLVQLAEVEVELNAAQKQAEEYQRKLDELRGSSLKDLEEYDPLNARLVAVDKQLATAEVCGLSSPFVVVAQLGYFTVCRRTLQLYGNNSMSCSPRLCGRSVRTVTV